MTGSDPLDDAINSMVFSPVPPSSDGCELVGTFDAGGRLDTPSEWAARISWAVTTAADCYGHNPDDPDAPEGWALYDAGEDDPPIAVFTFKEDALMVCEILQRASTEAT